MATKNFRSTVLEPTSEFAYGDKLRFTALSSINQVFKRSFSEVTIGVDGVYDIDLQYGKYRIDYKPYEGIWALFANVEVGAETTATTLQDLAMTSNPVTDDTILALQAILAETKVNAENAEKSSSDSIAAAAEAAKDRDEIEGMMLRAMTTADVEAVRSSNKALYAASGVDTWGTKGSIPVNALKNGLNCTTTANTLLFDGKFHIAGLIFDIPVNSPINFDAAADGKTTYNKTTGVVAKHDTAQAAFAASRADAAVEVVTDRTDVYALELYLRDITEVDPMVYPHGYIHAQDASINGAATSLDTIRPDSYYAHYLGQETVIRGKSINWFTATNDDKLAILSMADKHGYIHYDPKTGNWRQWCIRNADFSGVTNGDWLYIDSKLNSGLSFKGGSLAGYVHAQGDLDSREAISNVTNEIYLAINSSWSIEDKRRLGLFTALKAEKTQSSRAINGECYLLVLGTANRLNSGVWHPSYNPMGCYKFTSANLTPLGQGITSTEQCFLPENIGTVSARPDGRLPTLIYASGYGGVCRDMRYSAYHTTKEESDTQKSNAYNGTYRGFDKRAWSEIYEIGTGGHPNAAESFNLIDLEYPAVFTNAGAIHTLNAGDTVTVFKKGTSDYMRGSIFSASDAYVYLNRHDFVNNGFPDVGTGMADLVLVITRKLSQSIGGDFTHNDVAGGIEYIAQNPDLKNGWEGGIIADRPDGSSKYFYFTRQATGITVSLYTNSATHPWGASVSNQISYPNHAYYGPVSSTGLDVVAFFVYDTKAKHTTPSEIKSVYGNTGGLGEVYSSVHYTYNRTELGFSTVGVISRSSAPRHTEICNLEKSTLLDSGFVTVDGYQNKHAPVTLIGADDIRAFKALDYRVATYNQCSLNFAATELRWGEKDGVQSWGDDEQIHVVDNESTLIDKNGNNVKCATHTLSEPLGWVK